jgi:hypothetical protein
MSTLFFPEVWRRRLETARNAPPQIQWFALFSVIVCAADLWLTFAGPRHVKAMIIPFTGWSASTPYLFGLFWVFYLMFSPHRRGVHRLGLFAPLLISIVFGLLRLLQPRGEDFGNPYLQVSVWQPVWTIVIPAVWVVLLLLAPKAPQGQPERSVIARDMA